MFKTKVIILLFATVAMSACKKKEVSEFTDTPIIEAYLTAGDYFSIKLSRQVPFSSDVNYSSDNINDVSVKVMLNDVDYLLQPAGEGFYKSSSLIVSPGDQYNLSFSFNKKNVSAYTYVPNKPSGFTTSVSEISLQKIDSTTIGSGSFNGTMPDPVKLSWNNTDGSYYLVLVENIETTLVPIRSFGGNAPPGNRFKKQPVTGSGQELRAMEFQYFGKHRIILYHVLPDYATLYDQTSSSSQNLTNPSTSIVNGYGIFTGLNSDTLYVEVKQL